MQKKRVLREGNAENKSVRVGRRVALVDPRDTRVLVGDVVGVDLSQSNVFLWMAQRPWQIASVLLTA
jgi:hypothetical protein